MSETREMSPHEVELLQKLIDMRRDRDRLSEENERLRRYWNDAIWIFRRWNAAATRSEMARAIIDLMERIENDGEWTFHEG